MKNELIKSILSQFCDGNISTILDVICGLDWRIETAKDNELVAYNLAAGDLALGVLEDRLRNSKAIVLLLSRRPSRPISRPYIVIREDSWVECLSQLCDVFYPLQPNLSILAITGTNGKTTTADLVLQLGEAAGLRGLSIGTLGVRQQGKILEDMGATTPGQVQLRQILHRYGGSLDFVVMEASSHALDQQRIAGLVFTAAAWTSFTQDHLDYHRSMGEYFAAKKKIIGYLKPGAALIVPNTQKALIDQLKDCPCLELTRDFSESDREVLPPFFKASFNLDNLACAVGLLAKIHVYVSREKLKNLASPPGRFYVREWDDRAAVVDFAHTPDALENILRGIRGSYPRHRLVVLFGCGGDRDRSKRPLMGKVASQLANRIILTSDNPRSEDPVSIIQDIRAGVGSHPAVEVTVERPLAVRSALTNLAAGELLVLAGKGHEDYILIGTTKHPYSDIEELENFYKSRRNTP